MIYFFIGKNFFSHKEEFIKKKYIININELIFHHLNDSHKWIFYEIANKNISLLFPIILWDKGFHFFKSTYLYNRKYDFKNDVFFYKTIQDKIYRTDIYGSLKKNTLGIILNKNPLDLSITKNVFASFISFLIMSLFLKKTHYIYKGHQAISFIFKILEPFISFIKYEVTIPHIGVNKYKPYLPWLLTVFFYIFLNNLFGFFPTGANVTGDISTTFLLSFTIFIIVNINSNKSYWRHILWMPDIPYIVRILLAPIELIGIIIRPITLCIRLFANITAGHIIILSFISLIFIFKNIPVILLSVSFSLFILLLKIIVAFLQSFIFTTLSALFIGRAIH